MKRRVTDAEKTVCRLACLLLCLLLFASGPAVFAAGKKLKLSKTKLTLTAGESKKLTVSGAKKKVRWSVSGRRLVTVKTSGKRRQKAVLTAGEIPGTCTVKAKSGKKTVKCRVTVKKAKDFTEKPLGKSSRNRTKEFAAGTIPEKQPDEAFLGAAADTSVRLLQEVLADEGSGKNVLLSPDSVLTALALVENAAGGATRAELEEALGGVSVSDYTAMLASLHKRITASDALTYRIANALWYREKAIAVKDSFLQRAVDAFRAEVYAAPFDEGTVKDINTWVYNKTNGKIAKILERLGPESRAAVLNAVYFRGDWQTKYPQTVQREFAAAGDSRKNVPMLEGTERTWLTVDGAEGFVKPYRGGELAFLGLLPPEGTSPEQFLKGMTGEKWMRAYANRRTSGVLVRTRMPEFHYEYSVSLEKPLRRMGVRQAFSDGADFSGLTDDPVCLDAILHKTYINLNKNGTEAAAVTAVIVKAGSVRPPEQLEEKQVYLDRPFVYAIVDTQTGLPLFLGVVSRV